MNEQESVEIQQETPPPARRRTSWLTPVLLLFAFLIGIGVTIWAMPQIEQRWGKDEAATPALPAPLLGSNTIPSGRPLTADAAQMLDARVIQLEERLNRITVEAQAASGNAARAEGLLVAFAARRALDTGAPLGYVEGQLRLRFGQAQPRAVATIINAAREPVTLADLRAGLVDVADRVTSPPADASWWDSFEHEARELIIIRKSSTPRRGRKWRCSGRCAISTPAGSARRWPRWSACPIALRPIAGCNMPAAIWRRAGRST